MPDEFRILRAKPGKTRREEIDGVEYLVAPMVALRTGVYQCANCEHPELYSASVFARIPESWNDRPVTLGHPMRGGVFVSAGSQDVWTQEGLGRIRNARRSGEKLLLEAWIDLEKADQIGDEATDLVSLLEDDEGIDVSVGAFVETHDKPGTFRGKEYQRQQLSYVPDHVALLPGQTGACSWEDGCGAPRVNHEHIEANLMTLQTGGPLRDGNGRFLPNDAVAGEGGTPEAILPLERLPSGDLRLKINKPCSCGGEGGTCTCGEPAEVESLLTGLLSFEASAISDKARMQIIMTGLKEKIGRNKYFYIVEVFDDKVIYESEGGVYSRDYSISGDGSTVTLADSEVRGTLIAEFKPITVQQEKTMKERQKAVDRLIASTKWTEEDRDGLLAMSDTSFARLVANEEETSASETQEDDDAAATDAEDEDETTEDEPTASAANSVEAYLAQAPDEIRGVLEEGRQVLAAKRKRMIDALDANDQCTFSRAELEACETPNLEKLCKLAANNTVARPGNYVGAAPAAATVKSPFANAPKPVDWAKQ